MRSSTGRVIASGAAIACLAGASMADIIEFSAGLSGANEVPPNASPAVGTLSGLFDTDTSTFSFSWEIQDLLGAPTGGAHIHNAPAGSNGGVVFAMSFGAWNPVGADVWAGMSQAHVDALFAGNLYANFHTSQFAGGEVRGQIREIPAPGSLTLAVACGLAGARRRRSP